MGVAVRMEVIIRKSSGTSHELLLEMDPNCTVLDVKKEIEVREGILHKNQGLSFDGCEMENDMVIGSANQDTITMDLDLGQRRDLRKWGLQSMFQKNRKDK